MTERGLPSPGEAVEIAEDYLREARLPQKGIQFAICVISGYWDSERALEHTIDGVGFVKFVDQLKEETRSVALPVALVIQNLSISDYRDAAEAKRVDLCQKQDMRQMSDWAMRVVVLDEAIAYKAQRDASELRLRNLQNPK